MNKQILKSRKKNKSIAIGLLLLVILKSGITFSEMCPVSDSELSEVTGQQGFSQFTLTEDGMRMRLDLDVKISSIVTMEDLRLGYYSIDSSVQTGTQILFYECGNDTGWGWALDFEDLQMGKFSGDPYGSSGNTPFVMDGISLRVDYEMADGAKMLKSFAIGSEKASGVMYAQHMWAYSGKMNTSLAAMPLPAIALWSYRTSILENHNSVNHCRSGFTFNNQGLYMTVDKDRGVGFVSGYGLNDF